MRNNLARQVAPRNSTSAQLAHAAIPVYGVSWEKAVIRHLATNRINDILAMMRRSPSSPKKVYGRLAAFTLGDFAASGPFPPEMLERSTMAGRSRLYISTGRGVVLEVCAQLAASGLNIPFDLSRVTPSEAHHRALESPTPSAMRAVWSASRTDSSASSTNAAEYPAPAHDLFANDSILKAIHRRSDQFPRTGKTAVRTNNKLPMRESFS